MAHSQSKMANRFGIFHLLRVLAVESKVLQKVGDYPDQVPYILVWKDLVTNPLPWVKSCLLPLTYVTLPPETACSDGKRMKMGRFQASKGSLSFSTGQYTRGGHISSPFYLTDSAAWGRELH